MKATLDLAFWLIMAMALICGLFGTVLHLMPPPLEAPRDDSNLKWEDTETLEGSPPHAEGRHGAKDAALD